MSKINYFCLPKGANCIQFAVFTDQKHHPMSHSIKDSQFVKLLAVLEESEWKAFEKFLNAGNALRVYKYILKSKPDFNDTRLDKRKAFSKIFAGEPYKYDKITNLLSALKRQLEAFLVQQELARQPVERAFLLLQNLHRRKSNKFFQEQVKRVQTVIQKTAEVHNWDYLYQLKLYHLLYHRASTERLDVRNDYLQAAVKALDLFFVTTKLKYSCEVFSRENLLKQERTNHLLQTNYSFADESKELTFVNIYHQTLYLITEGNAEVYQQIKQRLLTYREFLTTRDLHIINSYLLNFANRKIKQGEDKYIQEAYDLYVAALAGNYLIIDRHITPVRFLNIVTVACDLKHIQWVEEFIEKWKELLNKDCRAEIVGIGKAMCLFEQRNFPEVIHLVSNIRFVNVLNYARSRTLAVRSCYELNNESWFTSNCKSFYTYLKTDKNINEAVKKPFYVFLRIMEKLMQIKRVPDKAEQKIILGKIKKLLQNEPAIICRKWINQTVKTLITEKSLGS